MTTPIVTETRRHGSQIGNPTSGGQPTPAPVSADRARERRSHGLHGSPHPMPSDSEAWTRPGWLPSGSV